MKRVRQKQEHELKLEPQSNFQLKYLGIEKPEAFRRKFEMLLKLLNLNATSTRMYKLQDLYFDDSQSSLTHSGYSLRARKGEAEDAAVYTVTLKSADETPALQGLLRNESPFECEEEELKSILSKPSQFVTRFGKGVPEPKGTLTRILTVYNDRLEVGFLTRVGRWKMCYDRFYYFHASDGSWSPYFSEVELEHEGDGAVSDPDIASVELAMKEIFGLHAHKQAKLERGQNWFARPHPAITTVHTMGFDIVGYPTHHHVHAVVTTVTEGGGDAATLRGVLLTAARTSRSTP